jgi:uncharacterized protein (UPF0332 family)
MAPGSTHRYYFACFQAAMAALLRQGVDARSHRAVQALFSRELINRLRENSGDMRDVLSSLMVIRQTADYKADQISRSEAARSLAVARRFAQQIVAKGGEGCEN